MPSNQQNRLGDVATRNAVLLEVVAQILKTLRRLTTCSAVSYPDVKYRGEEDSIGERQSYHKVPAFHDRLPPEIWVEIFLFCLPGWYPILQMPPKENRAPWLLGHVCTAWRQISRAEPRLWRTAHLTLDYKSLWLRRTCEILPPFVPLHVRCHLPITMSETLSCCWRIQSLAVLMKAREVAGFFKSVTRFHNCLAKIQSFTIQILGLPNDIDNKLALSWDFLAPLKGLPSLQHFALDGLSGQSRFPFSSLHVPWSQLLSARICIGPNAEGFFNDFKGCNNMEKLELCFLDPWHQNIAMSIPSHITPGLVNLKELKLSGSVPSVFIDYLAGLPKVTQLDLNVDGDMLYEILVNGEHLKSISTSVQNRPHKTTHLRDLHMPRLQKLTLFNVDDNWLFEVLKPYALKELTINQYCTELENSLDHAVIDKMISVSTSSESIIPSVTIREIRYRRR